MTVTYLSREQWGAGPLSVGHSAPHSQFVGLVAHHTVMVQSDTYTVDEAIAYMRQLQHARPDLGPDVPYSFVVFEGAAGGDSIVAEGRGFGRTGAHTEGLNSTRYGVAHAGNSSTRPVTDGVLDGYRWVGRQLHNPTGAQATIGHRDTKSTECPGHSLYAALPQIQPPFTDTEEGPEMDDTEHAALMQTNHTVHQVLVPKTNELDSDLAGVKGTVDTINKSLDRFRKDPAGDGTFHGGMSALIDQRVAAKLAEVGLTPPVTPG